MSFKVNSSQQISFNDSVFSLTAREKKALDNSWAKIFADEIFPNIDEERFSMWNSSNISRTQEVYMSDISFGEVKMLRHSGSSTQFSLDSYSTTTTGTQPIMDRQDTGSMPDWSKLRYGGVPTTGNVNVFSIDCRPQ